MLIFCNILYYFFQFMKSIATPVGTLLGLPAFTGTGTYMHKTRMDELVLPATLRDYTPVIDHMLSCLKDRAAVCYITIDEKVVHNTTHRRAGAHVDHNWYEGVGMHQGNTGHMPAPAPQWSPKPQWRTNNGHLPAPRQPVTPSHSPARTGIHNGLVMDEFNGGMLLASNYAACQVWKGDFAGTIGEGGCCKAIDFSTLATEVMPANAVYYLNPLGIHESLPITDTVERQLVRINFHPDYIPQLV